MKHKENIVQGLNIGRFTSSASQDVTVFMLGVRINSPLRPDAYVPVMRAYQKMVKYLEQHPETGFLGQELWVKRTILAVQYWESPEALQDFASLTEAPHVQAWRNFTQKANHHVGLWHETYQVSAPARESIYLNMPNFGLGKALGVEPIGKETSTAKRRMSRWNNS